jgi:hypothetical protein
MIMSRLRDQGHGLFGSRNIARLLDCEFDASFLEQLESMSIT